MMILSRLAVSTRSVATLLPRLPNVRIPNTCIWHRSFRNMRQKTHKDRSIELAPKTDFETPNIMNMYRQVGKCALFTAGFCSFTFVGVTVWQYETLRTRELHSDSLLQWTQSQWNSLEGWENKEGGFRKELNRWWNNLSEGQKVFWPICFLNVIVFAAWQRPALQSTMLRYFAFSPAAHAVCWPMLLSTFSHYNIFHLAANMYVLHSFSTNACSKLGKEQFTFMYLNCGMISALASAIMKAVTLSPSPSLGASGAIMGLLGYFCTTYPNSQLGIIFIPGFHFSAENALIGILCLDAAGLIFRWSLFDHAAHLAGVLSGVVYANWGKDVWVKRQPVMQAWHDLRLQVEELIKKYR